ncbi:hypothetical protein [Methylobacterium nodulans]|uniref:Glycosyl transferase family 2 n=1 Tax=Methylobacterium nodulans (strain LMG 21967 / CNCM I-2342 / ORS 2060) TaxID=460265 RepID=B8IU39_METNO|nr:hypothetical protein [Methylobacterium nodulans]ACL60897.1 conserved hypothetical protein [Methylobacterium nodulans ORS 2060]
MITAVVHVSEAEAPGAIEALADSLSALVAGVAAGVVGDAVIVAGDPTDRDLALVADRTGAALVARGRNPWVAAAAVARRPWLLCLEAGDVPAEGWIRTLDRFAGTAAPDTVVGRLRRAHAPLRARLAAQWEALAGTRRVRAGDVVRREALASGLPFRAPKRVRRLNGVLVRE